jgi:ubiquinone/menaquinone biosynthesis C-methylase UbiE
METLREYWNQSTARIPAGKDPSTYAKEKEPSFPRSSTVLDLGGGSGTDSIFFARLGHTVSLVDIADTGLQRARQAAEEAGVADAIDTTQVDLEEGRLPLETASFNVVFSRLALHYFNPETTTRLFSEVYRVLKPGGHAYLTVKSADDTKEMEYLRSTTTEESEGLFNENGFLKARYTVQLLGNFLKTAGIDENNYSIQPYVEQLGGRKDVVRSGKSEFVLNEIEISKPVLSA